MNTNTLLADPVAIEIEKFVATDDSIKIVVRSIQKAANCPQCGETSSSLKTRYVRQLTDLPWHDVAVRLELHSRKFRCRNEICRQKVFCERLPNVADVYARRTVRLMETLTLLAFTLGGRGGSRAAAKLNFPAGKDILLRSVRQTNEKVENKHPVKVLGVDDFAFRKGISYGTILVDLERRQPIDLLPDRSAATLSKWLTMHPEIEVVSRDRSRIYADAVNTALPHVAQV